MNLFQRSRELLSPSLYGSAVPGAVLVGTETLRVPKLQYILRMCVGNPSVSGYRFPTELYWVWPLFAKCLAMQKGYFSRIHPYVYVTVRSGYYHAKTNDTWHVDGFSMKKEHVPEQNYLWSNCYGTEYADHSIAIPDDFDPFKHDIHKYFQEHTKTCQTMQDGGIYVIDPYVVHRRQPGIPNNRHRCFVRISFVPIEIQDDNCTRNPLLPTPTYNNSDIRKTLVEYK